MNSNIKTGGPAFPTDNAHQTGPHSYHAEGMTLRDWFAGMALQSMINHALKSNDRPWPGEDEMLLDSIATDAYLMADAMIVVREAL